MIGFDDFLCSDAVFGLSGVVLTLAGVAATGDEEFFSIISAGIFFIFIFKKKIVVYIYKHFILSKNSTTIQLFAPLFA